LNILFVCVENSNRSQMAEAFGHIHKTTGIEVYSAGSKPSGKINPKAISALKLLEYNMQATHSSKNVNELKNINFDVVISMGCGDDCPHIQCNRREDWQIPDPKHLSEKEYLTIRDYISIKVQELINSLSS